MVENDEGAVNSRGKLIITFSGHGKEFFKGVNVRYHRYAVLLSGKLGMPVDFIQGMIYIFVRACVHYALFEDEEYLKLQLDAIRTSLRLFVKESKPKEEIL